MMILNKLKGKVDRLIDKYLFRDTFSPPSERGEIPPVSVGDAVSSETAATINCYSMPVANRLIDCFISKQLGEKGIYWKPEIEYFVNKREDTEFTIRAIDIVTTSGESHTYYFDVSQPMRASMSLVNAIADNKASVLDRCFNVLKRNGE